MPVNMEFDGKAGEGKHFIIDEEDVERVEPYSWYYQRETGFVVGYINNTLVTLARYLINPDPDKIVTYDNGNRLDCRRSNLVVTDRSQHWDEIDIAKIITKSQYAGKPTSSVYTGVMWRKDRKRWRAIIKGRHLGYFVSEIEAAEAYDREALEEYGKRINFPER